MTKTVTLTEAQNTLPTLVETLQKDMDEYVITVNGKSAAVLISIKQYESWKEISKK